MTGRNLIRQRVQELRENHGLHLVHTLNKGTDMYDEGQNRPIDMVYLYSWVRETTPSVVIITCDWLRHKWSTRVISMVKEVGDRGILGD